MSSTTIKVGNTPVILPAPAEGRVEMIGLTLVLLDPRSLSEEDAAENVWAFDSSGKLVWKIQKGGEDKGSVAGSYSLLRKDDLNRVWVNAGDQPYRVNAFGGIIFDRREPIPPQVFKVLIKFESRDVRSGAEVLEAIINLN